MYEHNAHQYLQLDTEKYWLPVKRMDAKLIRKLERRQAIGRLLMFCCFATGAYLGYLYCTGQFDNMDIQIGVERFRSYFGV